MQDHRLPGNGFFRFLKISELDRVIVDVAAAAFFYDRCIFRQRLRCRNTVVFFRTAIVHGNERHLAFPAFETYHRADGKTEAGEKKNKC